jgi:hypothetical protein
MLQLSPALHAATAAVLLLTLKITKEEYAKFGAAKLGASLVSQLQSQGHRPFYIPVGGSSAFGCWGYLQAIQEIREQSQELGVSFDAIAMVSMLNQQAQLRYCLPLQPCRYQQLTVAAAAVPLADSLTK